MSAVIYIEGTQDLDNGDLRKAFAKLFEKELRGRMPKIVMGNGKWQTIEKFHLTPIKADEVRFLLVDSDAPVVAKPDICSQFNRKVTNPKHVCSESNTYLMIQEAEAWILSQPAVLMKRGVKVSRLPKKNAMEIANPSDLIAEMYKDSGKEYHKVRDFCLLFPDLDTNALKACFSEFKELLASLEK